MSYSISISGYKNTSSNEESKAFEEDVFKKAQDFVASLEGVTNATMSSGLGYKSLFTKGGG